MASLNVYEMVTERIIKQLEQGTIPWQKPWGGVRSGAFNRISKRPYSLKNQLLLEHPGEYCSFQQWKSLGGHIKKGAKSEFVERFPELSLFFKAYSLLDSEMICIFPYFCPYAESAREIREIFS